VSNVDTSRTPSTEDVLRDESVSENADAVKTRAQRGGRRASSRGGGGSAVPVTVSTQTIEAVCIGSIVGMPGQLLRPVSTRHPAVERRRADGLQASSRDAGVSAGVALDHGRAGRYPGTRRAPQLPALEIWWWTSHYGWRAYRWSTGLAATASERFGASALVLRCECLGASAWVREFVPGCGCEKNASRAPDQVPA
jgi:hypothetical protein